MCFLPLGIWRKTFRCFCGSTCVLYSKVTIIIHILYELSPFVILCHSVHLQYAFGLYVSYVLTYRYIINCRRAYRENIYIYIYANDTFVSIAQESAEKQNEKKKNYIFLLKKKRGKCTK